MVESFSLSQNQTRKMVYVEAKSDQYERSYVCLKFNSILSRATLARFVRTLQARSSAHSDQILFPHIIFFSSGSDLNNTFWELFTQKFSYSFPPHFCKNGKFRFKSLNRVASLKPSLGFTLGSDKLKLLELRYWVHKPHLSKAHSFYTVRFEKLNNCGENAALLDGPP